MLNFRIFIFSFFIFLLSFLENYSQTKPSLEHFHSDVNLGLGIGIDYGGLGIRGTFLPDKHVALFAAGGYNLVGFSHNLGTSIRFNPEQRTCFYYTIMHGYNAVVKIMDGPEYNRIYYGISTGFGIEVHSRRKIGDFWNIELLIPFRKKEFHNYLDELKSNPLIRIDVEPIPVAFSVGYHFN